MLSFLIGCNAMPVIFLPLLLLGPSVVLFKSGMCLLRALELPQFDADMLLWW